MFLSHLCLIFKPFLFFMPHFCLKIIIQFYTVTLCHLHGITFISFCTVPLYLVHGILCCAELFFISTSYLQCVLIPAWQQSCSLCPVLRNAGIISPVFSIRLRGDRYKAKFPPLFTSDSCWKRTSICSFIEDVPQPLPRKIRDHKWKERRSILSRNCLSARLSD